MVANWLQAPLIFLEFFFFSFFYINTVVLGGAAPLDCQGASLDTAVLCEYACLLLLKADYRRSLQNDKCLETFLYHEVSQSQ